MNQKNRSQGASLFRLALLSAAVATISACTSVGYRCPLDPNETADTDGACADMHSAMAGARAGAGSKLSAILDSKGRLIPTELLENKSINPLKAGASEGVYRNKSGEPVFIQPKVYQVWSESFQDAKGNLHDGHHSWFSTPGRWAYGTLAGSTPVGANLMGPSRPSDVPDGRLVNVDPRTGLVVGAEPQRPTPLTPEQRQAAGQAAATSAQAMTGQPQGTSSPNLSAQQQRDRAALANLSNMAGSFRNGGVTAPAAKLGN